MDLSKCQYSLFGLNIIEKYTNKHVYLVLVTYVEHFSTTITKGSKTKQKI